jgi:hypothetical protein
LRESPKASPTILIPKGLLETEGNVLKRVIAVRMIEREMGNPQPSLSVPGLFRDDWGQRASHAGFLVSMLLLCAHLVPFLPLALVRGEGPSTRWGPVAAIKGHSGGTRCLVAAQGIVSPARKGASGCVILG